jgi:hypothetical protein
MPKPTLASVLARYDMVPNRAGFIPCPVHGEENPSCQVHEDWWYCFGCGATGDSLGMIAIVQKRPIADVLREFSEKTPAWQQASKRTEHLNPLTLLRATAQAMRLLNSWFFKELAARLEDAPDWLMERTIVYWDEVFSDTDTTVKEMVDAGRRSDAEALLKGFRALLERGLGIEGDSWSVTRTGLWLLAQAPVQEALADV